MEMLTGHIAGAHDWYREYLPSYYFHSCIDIWLTLWLFLMSVSNEQSHSTDKALLSSSRVLHLNAVPAASVNDVSTLLMAVFISLCVAIDLRVLNWQAFKLWLCCIECPEKLCHVDSAGAIPLRNITVMFLLLNQLYCPNWVFPCERTWIYP